LGFRLLPLLLFHGLSDPSLPLRTKKLCPLLPLLLHTNEMKRHPVVVIFIVFLHETNDTLDRNNCGNWLFQRADWLGNPFRWLVKGPYDDRRIIQGNRHVVA